MTNLNFVSGIYKGGIKSWTIKLRHKIEAFGEVCFRHNFDTNILILILVQANQDEALFARDYEARGSPDVGEMKKILFLICRANIEVI